MNRVALPLGLLVISFTFLWVLNAGDPPRTGPATEKRFPPLKVPPGFKATLFACDPLIEYPSVISIGPKPGAIFVAIDYMTGLGSDGKVKSEIRLVEDTDGDGYADKATVVAKGFNSIQGLAFHDGTLYVMHAPFLTALHEKAQGRPSLGFEDRKDLLTGLGLKPEDNSSRLHCANGVVVGHDGWLYLAMGDNGTNVLRPEGDRLIFNGGGILRCRPDGRDLHVFSTGLRNIYDIALDAELNVFTRDNENDGGTYMIRVCHSFFGADHGYPYHYEERKAEAMPPLGDFGLGSSAGGVCYLEMQFSPEYRGNLFFAEWGKSVVRYPLQRVGSGFAPVKELEFAAGDSKDTYPFKPTDIVVQRDGTMMVADYADGQRPKRGRGRIYHIQHVGQASEPVKNKPKSDLEKLNSESYFERCEAQTAYERRGDAGRNDLGNAFRANKLGPRGFGHALLALSKGTEGTGLRDMLVMAHGGGGPAVRAQAIRIIADLTDSILVKHKLDAGRGDVEIAKTLASLEDRGDPRIMLEIVIALGRLRWADAPGWLKQNLTKPDATLAHAAQQTLRRADNWPAVVKLLDEPDEAPIRTIALRAIAERHEPQVVDGLIERLKSEKDVSRRREYADALTRVYKKPATWKYWGYRPGPRPANTEVWERTETIEKALDLYLASDNREERAVILKGMEREKVPVRVATLTSWLKDEYQPEAAAAILVKLKEHPTAELRESLQAVVRERKHSPQNRITAVGMLLNEKDANRLAILAGHAKSLEDGAVLAHVLRRFAIQAWQDDEAARIIEPKLKSADGEVRAAAMWGLGHMANTRLLPSLIPFLEDKDVRVRRAAASAAYITRDDKRVIQLLVKLARDSDIETRRACLISLRSMNDPQCAPLAAEALAEPALTMAALECVRGGGAKYADAVIAIAKRDLRSDVLHFAVSTLSSWSVTQVETTRTQMNAAIAEIQGSHGNLVRWRAVGPLADDERLKAIKLFAAKANSPDHPKLKKYFGTHEVYDFRIGRVALAPYDPKTPTWLAYTDVIVAAPTSVEFLGTSGGSFEVYLNGKSIHRRATPGKFQPDSERFTATLDKGINRILVQTGASLVVEFDLTFRRKSSKAEHEKLALAALSRTGNAERGRKLYFDKEKSQCIKCHRMGDQGESIGPDLSGVGARFSRIHIVESILEPSRTIAPSFGTFVVTLKNGKTLNGVKVAETDAMLTFADNTGLKHPLSKASIDELQPSPVSTMPDGLEQRLTADEFVDLIAFLTSQKDKS
ncbi:MAG: c-type cytochrome [Gemmataceae bacterium]|nr:c-type cytochrome [Gemmataceae bacterium]